MDNTIELCRNCSIKSNAVSILNNEELSVLEKACLQLKFKKGELVFKEGTPANQIVYLREGFVKLSKRGVGGKEYILSISKKGAYLGIHNLDKAVRQYYVSATSITDCEVCFIDIDKFALLLKRNGNFALEVISYIFDDEMNYFERLIKNVQQQLPGRLANTLFYFTEQVYGENSFNMNLTKTELASLIGTSRESVTRLLKEFQDDDIINIEKNRITILDRDKLENIRMKG
jgi:CRP-like cAMP-binding protein